MDRTSARFTGTARPFQRDDSVKQSMSTQRRLAASIALAAICSLGTQAAADTPSPRPPNVLLIMADDLGFSDLGCYGGEIHTPNLDRLAKNGLRFTQFYNTARCWPSRAALLTGYYAQQVGRDTLPGITRGNRPTWAPLLPRLLEPAGYRSYHSGKWHIDGLPIANGFHRSYYLKDQGRFFYPQVHHEDDKRLPAVKPGTDYYATTAIADHAIKCLKEHQAEHTQQPFFHYLAFTAPHFPLHALPQDIARYRDVYQVGWDKIREQRWRRIQSMGIVPGQLSEVEQDIGPPYDFPEAFEILGPGEINRPLPWDRLTAEQKTFQANKMAVHAAMIDRIDQEIGRVLEQLERMQVLNNTLIMFLSDNGASAEIMVRADGHDPQAAPGSAASYLCLGPGWSTACNTPFRRHKTWVHQGGISTPLVVHWPDGIRDRGQLRRTPGHVIDIVPTILELAAVQTATPQAGQPSASPQAPPRPGHSLLSVLQQNDAPLPRESIWWCHEGNKAIRMGDWKLVSAQGDPPELFHISRDPTETHDLSGEFPDRVAQLQAEWEKLAARFIQLNQSRRDSRSK